MNSDWANLVLSFKKNGYIKNSKVKEYLASSDPYYTKLMLKFGLYFNKHKQVLKFYDLIPVELFSDPTLRTLVALNLYNDGNFAGAMKLAQSLNNSNTNKIKGHEEVRKGKYKTAYSHYVSNLLAKPYSINNNQLILASALLSENYYAARLALSKTPVSQKFSREKELLRINLLLKEGKKREANYLMKNLDIRYNKKLPYEAAILSGYLKLIDGDPEWKELSDKSCLNKNVISCWLHMQSKIWPDYTKDIINKNSKMEPKLIQDRLEEMITRKEAKVLKGPVLIYQKDIYELDLVEYPELETRTNSDSQY